MPRPLRMARKSLLANWEPWLEMIFHGSPWRRKYSRMKLFAAPSASILSQQGMRCTSFACQSAMSCSALYPSTSGRLVMGSTRRCTRIVASAASSHHLQAPLCLADTRRHPQSPDVFPNARMRLESYELSRMRSSALTQTHAASTPAQMTCDAVRLARSPTDNVPNVRNVFQVQYERLESGALRHSELDSRPPLSLLFPSPSLLSYFRTYLGHSGPHRYSLHRA